MSQTENASGTAAYFDMLSNYTVSDNEEKCGNGMLGNEKMQDGGGIIRQ
jgi:hypothetical protein